MLFSERSEVNLIDILSLLNSANDPPVLIKNDEICLLKYRTLNVILFFIVRTQWVTQEH